MTEKQKQIFLESLEKAQSLKHKYALSDAEFSTMLREPQPEVSEAIQARYNLLAAMLETVGFDCLVERTKAIATNPCNDL